MPSMTAAIFGAVAWICATMRSLPPELKWLRHAVPVGASAPSCAHVTAAPTSPTSLPPMPIVTSFVSGAQAVELRRG